MKGYVKMDIEKCIIWFFIGMIGITTLNIVGNMLLNPIQTKGIITCDSGFIGIDLESKNKIQEVPCKKTIYDVETGQYEEINTDKICYEQTLLLDHINLKNIDNINCNIEYETEFPSFMLHTILDNI